VHQLVYQTRVRQHVPVQRLHHHLVGLAPHLDLVDPEGVKLFGPPQLDPGELEVKWLVKGYQLRELEVVAFYVVVLVLRVVLPVLARK